ncbi:MAG: CopG family transcriptional regulator [Candidatus Omnitrophica bacterium]|nr:CopG family transcriptional regulator [Candidatus Omnitrophota bacterium]
MIKKINHSDMPIGKLTKIRDVLPLPSELAMPEETTKITISLNKSSVDFFKRQAKKFNTKYQRMIRELVDRYATEYSQEKKN